MSIHAIAITHTPDRLRRSLLGLACQSVEPQSITVACDVDEESIVDAVRGACSEFGLAVTLVLRAKHELSRSGQTRNNAVREIVRRGAGARDRLVFIDGDIVLSAGALATHARLGERGPLVLSWRHELTETQTAGFDEDALRAGSAPVEVTDRQRSDLDRRHRRFVRQARLRRLRMTKPHKPKLLSANFSVPLDVYAEVNGFDETYEGWGQEDDDLGRRIYQAGHRPVVAVRDIEAWHQYHPTRAPRRLADCPNFARLSRPAATRCARGLESPVEQHAVRVVELR